MLAGSTCLMNKDMIKLTSYKKADSYGIQCSWRFSRYWEALISEYLENLQETYPGCRQYLVVLHTNDNKDIAFKW